MIEVKTVSECINKCDFFRKSMDGMECGHPYFKDKNPYDNMIISQTDIDVIPKKCPLRKEDLEIIYTISAMFN